MAKGPQRFLDSAGHALRKITLWTSADEKDVATSPVIEPSSGGISVDGLLIKDGSAQSAVIADPGNAGAISVAASGLCALTTAGAETRTLAAPSFAGQWMTICLAVDGGDAVITVATLINQTGNNTIAMNDAGDAVHLRSKLVGANIRWTIAHNDGATLSTV